MVASPMESLAAASSGHESASTFNFVEDHRAVCSEKAAQGVCWSALFSFAGFLFQLFFNSPFG